MFNDFYNFNKCVTQRIDMNVNLNLKHKFRFQKINGTYMQSHIDSIHSPQRTRNTIMKLCMKSVKFHRGIIF